MAEIKGRCLCGAVRVRIFGTAGFAIRCHCRDCQKLSGGGSLPQVAFLRDEVTLDGPLKIHTLQSDAGYAGAFGFCGICGSPICKSTDRAPDRLFIVAAALDDPGAVPPLQVVHQDRRPPWDGAEG